MKYKPALPAEVVDAMSPEDRVSYYKYALLSGTINNLNIHLKISDLAYTMKYGENKPKQMSISFAEWVEAFYEYEI